MKAIFGFIYGALNGVIAGVIICGILWVVITIILIISQEGERIKIMMELEDTGLSLELKIKEIDNKKNNFSFTFKKNNLNSEVLKNFDINTWDEECPF